ncbi:MAG: response regulator [Hyphomicrobiales bacterium]
MFILEDEPMLAIELENELEAAGFEVAATAASVESGLAKIRSVQFDVAVLDANLFGQSSEPVASALKQKRKPFVFISGYRREALPQGFEDIPLLSKPFNPSTLIEVLRQETQTDT